MTSCTELLFLDTIRVLAVEPDVAVIPTKYVINRRLYVGFGIARLLSLLFLFEIASCC